MNGDIDIEGCNINPIALTPEEAFLRAFGQTEFDISELSFSTYLVETARGTCNYIGIPVFPSRMFRHSAIYVRTDRIKKPSDLIGARVGVPEYQVTAAVWVRAFLESEYGVAPSQINWIGGGVEELGRVEKTPISLPDTIRMTRVTDKPLGAMLVDGDIDAIVAPRPPSAFTNKAAQIGRLFSDYRTVEIEYFRKTRLFPIMHLIGIRKELVETHPWLAASVTKAFEQSRRRCMAALYDPTALQVSLPWLVAEAEATQAIMGDDFWPYGVDANRHVIETLLDCHHRQGLSARRMTIDEIFARGAIAGVKI